MRSRRRICLLSAGVMAAAIVVLCLAVRRFGPGPAARPQEKTGHTTVDSTRHHSRSAVVAAAVDRPRTEVDAWLPPAWRAEMDDDELLKAVRPEVTASPADALGWAASWPDPEARARLLFAVVRAWAEVDGIAAVRWALARPAPRTERLLEAALSGAAAKPAIAVAIGRMLLQADPETAREYGAILLDSLSQAGAFQAACDLANETEGELRREWLAAVYRRWGSSNAAEALAAMGTVDPDAMPTVFHAFADGWMQRAPDELVVFLAKVPPSGDRDAVFSAALSRWAMQDPAALARWLTTLSPGPDFDRGAAAMLACSDQANRSTDVGLRWVESIGDAELRRASLLRVLEEWQRAQPDSARRYLERTAWLTPQEKNVLAASLDAEMAPAPES